MPGPADTAPGPRLDALLQAFDGRVEITERRLLAARILDRSTAWVFAHGDRILTEREAEELTALLERRATGEPIHYLLGEREFYGRPFLVDPSVLIPRPETEHLVESVLGLDLPPKARVVDIGTGSGCIALTLAAERPDWTVMGTDVSSEALAVAERNRTALGLGRVELRHADLLAGMAGPFDAVVSNPPYVADDDAHLETGDLRFEPRTALTDGADGLTLITRLVDQAFERLVPGGWLWLEHGHDQAPAVRGLLEQRGFGKVESRRDLAGIERISGGRRPG